MQYHDPSQMSLQNLKLEVKTKNDMQQPKVHTRITGANIFKALDIKVWSMEVYLTLLFSNQQKKSCQRQMKKVQLICDICWKFGWRKNTINLNQPGYDKKIQIVSNEKENASLTMY